MTPSAGISSLIATNGDRQTPDVVSAWMSTPAVIAPETLPLPVARKLLHEYRIRRLPVVDQRGSLVGIVTEGDINRISSSSNSDHDEYNLYYRIADLPLREFMRRPVITVTPDTPLFEAAHLMLTWRIHGLPVVQDNEVVGMISVSDMLRRLLDSGQTISKTVAEREAAPGRHRDGRG